MLIRSLCGVSLVVLAAIGLFDNPLALGADPAEKPSLGSVSQGEKLFSDDLSEPPGKAWRIAKGKWVVVDGAVQGAALKSDMHGAVMRHALDFQNAVIQFSFKLDGAKQISLSVNDAKGHVCRLIMRPTEFVVQKDDHDHDGPDKALVFARRQKKFEPGVWYPVTVEIVDQAMSAQVGDEPEVSGTHELLASPKSNFGFTVSGETASFKNVRVWKSTPRR